MERDFEIRAEVAKVDTSLGLVMGWAIVCKEDGVPYFDTQDDHVPESSMMEAAADFAKSGAMAGEQHTRSDAGTYLFMWPMTTDVAKAFGVETKKTGLMVAMKPDAEMLAKFQSGELTGFSIGGSRVTDETVSE